MTSSTSSVIVWCWRVWCPTALRYGCGSLCGSLCWSAGAVGFGASPPWDMGVGYFVGHFVCHFGLVVVQVVIIMIVVVVVLLIVIAVVVEVAKCFGHFQIIDKPLLCVLQVALVVVVWCWRVWCPTALGYGCGSLCGSLCWSLWIVCSASSSSSSSSSCGGSNGVLGTFSNH